MRADVGVRLDDYARPDGGIDWAAYHAAQVAAGQRCRDCGTHILFSTGSPAACSDCRLLVASPAAVSHDNRVRCPACRHVWSPWDECNVRLDQESIGVSCPACEHDFEVGLRVSVSFSSPPLVPEPAGPADAVDDEDEADEDQEDEA